MNKRLDETRNKHVRKATVLAHGKREKFDDYKIGDVVILPDDFYVSVPVNSYYDDNAHNQIGSKGKSIELDGEEYLIFRQSDIIAKVEE